jgi:hypothetical protein
MAHVHRPAFPGFSCAIEAEWTAQLQENDDGDYWNVQIDQ